MQFWYVLERKSLLGPHAEGRAPGRSHDTRAVPNPYGIALDKLPWFAMVLLTVLMTFCAP